MSSTRQCRDRQHEEATTVQGRKLTHFPSGGIDADDDPRLSVGLVSAVACLLGDHGYPDLTPAQYAHLLSCLWQVLYLSPAPADPVEPVVLAFETGVAVGERHGAASARRQALTVTP